MAAGFAEMQRVLAYVSAHLDGDVSLESLAAHAGYSPFHLHRTFSNAVGETPGQFTFRLRLARAALLLLTSEEPILEVALASGFRSHEVFCRAFHRRFGMTPSAYRKRGFAQSLKRSQVSDHAACVEQTAPCLGLYHMQQGSKSGRNDMAYSVTKKELAPQPVLVARRRVKRSEIAATIGAALPQVFAFAQQQGIALTGLPFTRYPEMGPGLITMEPGMKIASTTRSDSEEVPPLPGAGVVVDTLPGGPAATTMHTGPYEALPDAYAAVEQWIEDQGLAAAGAPWECYVNDPSEYPDPKDWKTEIFWPLRA